jgi:hypothetical protein
VPSPGSGSQGAISSEAHGRFGTLASGYQPMCPSASMTTVFCAPTPKSASASFASATVVAWPRRWNACSSRVASWPVHLMVTATCLPGSSATIGPWWGTHFSVRVTGAPPATGNW